MESLLLFHIAQMPVAGVPDRNRCRLHRDNAKQEVPGKKEFRQNKCIRHTPGKVTTVSELAQKVKLKTLQENLASFEMMTEWVDAPDVPPPHAFITAF
ncbi:MAG: hypothetical protein J6W00_12525 [Lentisphaeria bacterium]|nr:hypothetical protein [Lentisphaeria bacterium]